MKKKETNFENLHVPNRNKSYFGQEEKKNSEQQKSTNRSKKTRKNLIFMDKYRIVIFIPALIEKKWICSYYRDTTLFVSVFPLFTANFMVKSSMFFF